MTRRADYLRVGGAIIADAGLATIDFELCRTRARVLATARACGQALVPAEHREPRHRWHYRAWLWAAAALERHGLPPTDSETWEERCRIAQRLDKDLRAGRPIVHAALLWTEGLWSLYLDSWVCEHKPDLAAELQSTRRQLDDLERDVADDWREPEEGDE